MMINSHNEWDKLREVIVGQGGTKACLIFPRPGPIPPGLFEKAERLAREAYPQWLVDEINEDHEGLCDVLRKYGAKVYRPNNDVTDHFYTTPLWSAAGDNVCNARDLHLIVGGMVIESPSQERHRYFETMAYYPIWYQYLKDNGCRWVAGPKPLLRDGHMITYYEGDRDRYEDGQKFIKLTEDEILFEAANTVRMGRDLLYLVSRSGNYLGAKWLQSVIGPEYRVHTTKKIYKSSHIDSTVLCLRPRLVLLNASRVTEDICPEILNKWERIYLDEIVPTPLQEIEFQKNVRARVHAQLAELGVQSNLDSLASDWIGMNILSLDPHTVVVDERQVPLMRLLEKYGITCVPIRFRHSYSTGGIHCNTLDTVRESKLESYFD